MWSSDIQPEVHHLQKEQNSTCGFEMCRVRSPQVRASFWKWKSLKEKRDLKVRDSHGLIEGVPFCPFPKPAFNISLSALMTDYASPVFSNFNNFCTDMLYRFPGEMLSEVWN